MVCYYGLRHREGNTPREQFTLSLLVKEIVNLRKHLKVLQLKVREEPGRPCGHLKDVSLQESPPLKRQHPPRHHCAVPREERPRGHRGKIHPGSRIGITMRDLNTLGRQPPQNPLPQDHPLQNCQRFKTPTNRVSSTGGRRPEFGPGEGRWWTRLDLLGITVCHAVLFIVTAREEHDQVIPWSRSLGCYNRRENLFLPCHPV